MPLYDSFTLFLPALYSARLRGATWTRLRKVGPSLRLRRVISNPPPSPGHPPGCRDAGEASISGQRWEEGQALMLCKGAVWRSLGSWALLPYCSSPLYLPPPPRDTRTWREGKWTERRLERRSHPPGDQTLLRPRDLPSAGGGHRRC